MILYEWRGSSVDFSLIVRESILDDIKSMTTLRQVYDCQFLMYVLYDRH